MKKYALGDKVRVRRVIEAEKSWNREERRTKRKWISREEKLDGIVIGYRHVQEGVVEYWSDHVTFFPEKYIKCYLVAYDLHRKPVHVLPEDMEVLGDG